MRDLLIDLGLGWVALLSAFVLGTGIAAVWKDIGRPTPRSVLGFTLASAFCLVVIYVTGRILRAVF